MIQCLDAGDAASRVLYLGTGTDLHVVCAYLVLTARAPDYQGVRGSAPGDTRLSKPG